MTHLDDELYRTAVLQNETLRQDVNSLQTQIRLLRERAERLEVERDDWRHAAKQARRLLEMVALQERAKKEPGNA